MRVGLNLLHARPDIGGAWNYIENILKSLQYADESFEFVAYCRPEAAIIVPEKPNFKKVIIDIGSSQIKRALYENTMLQRIISADKLDVVHWFANTQALINTRPGVVTVYDMIMFTNKASYKLFAGLFYRTMMTLTLKHAGIVAPMSVHTRDDLHNILHLNENRMSVIVHPIQDSFRPCTIEHCEEFRSKYHLPKKFWVYVAHYYPHKNHEALIRAFAGLEPELRAEWPLVLRGNMKEMQPELQKVIVELGIQDYVIWLPPLTDNEMPLLYSSAGALVFPSLSEGAGIPILEAMACGCPITASDISPVREFGNKAVLYFDPKDIGSITSSMRKLQSDEQLRKSLVETGFIQSKEYTSQIVCSKLMDVYYKAASK